jgi:general secretion pathway protein K
MRVDFTSGGEGSERGFIVVAVLWILAALAALVLIYLSYVTNTAVVVAGSTDRIQTEALLGAAVELSAYHLTSVKKETRPTSGTFNARIGAALISVTFRSEAARIDLNSVSKGLLAGFIVGLGVQPANAASYADRIIAWRTPAASADDDPENSFYKTSGVAYVPRHAPFPQAEELWLVQGIPPLVVERMLPFVTVFSNLASVNVVDAAPQVLAALPRMTPATLNDILLQRGDPRSDPRTLLAAAGEGASLAGSASYRLSVSAILDNGRRSSAEIVILLLDERDEPYRILSWHNGFDGSAGLQPQQAGLR